MRKFIKVKANFLAKRELQRCVWNLRFAADLLESFAQDGVGDAYALEGDIIDALGQLQAFCLCNELRLTGADDVAGMLKRKLFSEVTGEPRYKRRIRSEHSVIVKGSTCV